MEGTMKAIYKMDDSKHFFVKEVPIPEVGPNDVLMKVDTIGICGTDVRIRDNSFVGRHGKVVPPLIPGHEFCGTVVEVGSQVSKFKVGQRVRETGSLFCGVCRECMAGRKCTHWTHWGIDKDGGFAEYCSLHQNSVGHVPDFMPFKHVPLIENAALAVTAVYDTNVRPGDVVAIYGVGSVGLLCVQTAKLCSPRKIIVVGLEDDGERFEIAKSLGATDIVVGGPGDEAVEKIMELTDGHGADIAIEATGKSKAVEDAIHCLAVSGTCIIAGSGFDGKTVNFRPWNFVRNENVIKTIQGYSDPAYAQMLDLYEAGMLDFDVVISHYIPLDEVNEACDLIEQKKALKVMMQPAIKEPVINK